MTTARVLDRPPVSGAVAEVHFDATGDCTWVEFDDGVETWCGVFGRGDCRTVRRAVVGDGETACILAGGRGYIVDLAGRTLLHRTRVDRLRDVLAVPGTGLFVAADDTCLLAYAARGEVWRSERIAMDEVELLGVESGVVRGRVQSIGPMVDFTLAVGTWKYSCAWRYPFA